MFIKNYFENIDYISKNIDKKKINQLVKYLVRVKKAKGRVFFLGVGGSAANCSHAVNDFRKLCSGTLQETRMKIDLYGDNIGKVEYISHMGNDLTGSTPLAYLLVLKKKTWILKMKS